MAARNLDGKVVVITGASSGFGRGAALDYAKHGASVVLVSRNASELETLATECQAYGGHALTVPTDVSLSLEVSAAAEAAVHQFGKIDVWVNNAGVGAVGRFDEIPLEDHLQVVGTNLLGTLYGSYFAMQIFQRQGFGTLINIASVLGKVPAPYYSSYAASKHGVVGLSAALRQELEQMKVEDIHVCTVLPTSFSTPFFEHASNYSGHQVVPIPPVYDPQQVVDVIVKLATEPQNEITVGTAATISVFAHKVAPGITEAVMGQQAHQAQIEEAPEAPDSPGTVHEPSAQRHIKQTA
jgi:short-subunit dehydrogenase